MKRLLWINACMRGEGKSRTEGLCQEFLAAWKEHNPGGEVVERDLTKGELPIMTAELAEQRDAAVQSGVADSPLLTIAKELAGADCVVIGVPYWDLSFPAVLKVYLEWASTVGVTFHYPDGGASEGLCKADNLLYITTAGGPVWGQNFGFDYVKALGAMLGISNAQCVAAEEQDAWGGPGEANLQKARAQLLALAETW